MRKARLLSTVAAALLFTAGAVSAQGVKKDEAPSPAPAAQQNAPAEKVAPPIKQGAQNTGAKKAPETTGQASDADKAGKTQSLDKGAMDKGASEKNLDKSMNKGAETKSPSDTKAGADVKAKENTAQDSSGMKSGKSLSEGKSASERDRATTGQGAAGSAKLSTEQRSKITTIFKQKKVEPAHLSISVRVGARVPESVHFYPIPTEVIVIYPEWRGYDYILVGDEILVIDPRTHEIVAILEA